MKILMLSWRYLGHPQAGGAEIVTHELLKRLVAEGHQVTCFTAAYPEGPAASTRDGVRLMYRGGPSTVQWHAWRWLRKSLKDYDRVIDQINTLPFMTPWYVPTKKRRFYINQLAREYWWRQTRGVWRLAAPVGFLLEPWSLRRYRTTRGVTVSPSSKAELIRIGIPARNAALMPLGLTRPPRKWLQKKVGPWTIIMVGRLTPAKYVEEGITAFRLLKQQLPEGRLWIVGRGQPVYRRRLERLVRQHNIADVRFFGRVSEAEKERLLAKAHAHLLTSHLEGWGLVVSESAAAGTPSVGYDVPGVRDSIGDRKLLGKVGQPRTLARLLERLHDDPSWYEHVRKAAWRRTKGMSYEQTLKAFKRTVL